ncbi:MAG TPA: 6-bladed beta-propeller [Solirubrobacteraceae bacterium]
MRVALRSLLVCVLGLLLGGSSFATSAWAGESAAGEASLGSSVMSDPLVVPGVQSLDGGEQVVDAREARRFSPAAVQAREESQSKYAGLNGVDAAKLAQEVFPATIEEAAGGPPKLSSGENITGFPAVNIAQVEQAGGGRSVVESSAPIAVERSPGQRAPIDLGLSEVGGAFEPKTALARIRVPKRLGDGVVLSGSGVSLTPVDAQGVALAGSEGSIEGTTVFYANTLTDADTMVKPTTFGFNVDTQLRSENSPQQLDYKVGLPQGASLVQDKEGGSIRVVDAGQTLATIAPPVAHDAEGTAVPVTMSVSGDVLSVALPSFAAYRLPIEVDPTVEDGTWQNEWYGETYYKTEWHFVKYGAGLGAPEHPEGGSWTEGIYYGHWSGEWGGLFYTTRGESQIVRAGMEGHWNDTGSHIQNYMLLETGKSPYLESYEPLPEATESNSGGDVCAPALGCSKTINGEAPAENGNTAGYKQLAYGNGEGHGGENTVTNAYVNITQEKGPELEFNKTSTTIYNALTKENLPNVLYGSGSWLGPHAGAFEVRAKDPGLGISTYRVLGPELQWGDVEYYRALGDCVGIQCPEYNYQGYTYRTGMPDGLSHFEAFVQDSASLYAQIPSQTIKVDATPPHSLKIVGFQNGNELPMGETHLKAEATDGEGTTKSSGIKSIKVSVDGNEVVSSTATCPEGPCTTNTEFTLIARDYTSGQHTMVVTATDNANNVAQEEFNFRVGGANPVSVGPGSVDPSDGQFTLNATDVSLGGTSGVSRTYQSRSLTSGAEGPLGPQWTISTGGGEGLTVVVSGSAVLNAANGANAIFTRNEKGEFESPSGDSNLKLESKEKVPGKGITEYILNAQTTGAKTKFEQPAAAQNTTPVFLNQFGAEAGQLKHPLSDAVDSSGNVWVTSNESDLVEKFSPTGVLKATYGSQGTGEKQFIGPWGIAIDPRNNNVYVSDQANNRVEELSSTGAFIKMFGWGVGKAAKAEFEICTTECKAGTAGTGNGQFSVMAGLAVDASGNVWVADFGNNRVQEFNEKGEYARKFGTVGKGAEQFEGPLNIAVYGSDLYITDYHNNRVQEFTTSGAHVKVFGEAGSENGKFSNPYGIAVDPRNGNVYVVDSANHRVQQFSSAGSFTTKFGSSGTGSGQFTTPTGIAIGLSGGIYVVDNGTNSLDAWERPLWLPTETGGALAASATTYAYTSVESEGQTVMQPTEALAPIPAGVSSCSPLVAGCRSLTFEYGKETTAKSEKQSEWGNYKGRLEKVWFHGYSPSAKEMIKSEVGRYEYDSKGRLRAEWDPRLEHALKTTYGYDAEGHVTAVTPPGQESWVFTYGTIAGDANEGRLLKVTRAPASASLWNGELPSNSAVPVLSGTTVVGVKMGVSNGTWSNSPVAYSYQWKDCNSSGGECVPILGATNANYTLQSSDVGHKIVAQVRATSGGGTVAAVTVASALVTSTGTKTQGTVYSPGAGSTVEYGVGLSGTGLPTLTKAEVEKWGQKDIPVEGSAIFPPDEPQGWPASAYTRATIHYWDSHGRSVNTAVPTKGISTSEYNEASEVTRTLSADNRAVALKEGCVSESKKECRSAEVSEKLDTETEYNPEETEILKVVGPEHEIKLSTGSEVEAREITHDYYDEDAKQAEEKNKEEYNLLTKTADGALLSDGEEKDVRTTIDSYNGQEDLGWMLRQATSTAIEPASSDLVHATVYNKTTGDVVETKAPEGTSETVYPLAYTGKFGSEGTGKGQFNHPLDIALNTAGDIWVDDRNNDRMEEFSSTGTFIAEYGSKGSGNDQFSNPWALAISQGSGDVYVADTGNNRIEDLGPSGEFVRVFGTEGAGKLEEPEGVTVDSSGDVWVSDSDHNRIVEFSSTGVFMREFGTHGTGNGQLENPEGLVISEGSLYVADLGNDRIEQFSLTGTYLNQFGSKGSGPGQLNEPVGVATNPTSGDLFVSDRGNHRVEEFSPAGKYLTAWSTWSETHEISSPMGLTISPVGKLYVADEESAMITEWLPPEAGGAHLNYGSTFGSKGSGNGQFAYPVMSAIDGHGNIWVTDYGNHRIEEFSSAGTFIAAYGKYGSGNGEFEDPQGIDINQSTSDVYVADAGNNRIEELSSTGEFIRALGTSGSGELDDPEGVKIDSSGNVWVADTDHNRIVEFSSTGTYIATYGKRGSGSSEFDEPTDIAFSGSNLYVTDSGNHRVQEFSDTGTYISQFGTEGGGSGEFYTPEGIAADSAGDLYVVDGPSGRVQEFSAAGVFRASFATKGSGEGQLNEPSGISINAAGDMYIDDTGENRVEEWTPANQAAHDTQTIYYTTETNPTYPNCGKHPEWANLVCQTQLAAQPESGLPELPVTTMTYNTWDEIEKTEEAFGTGAKTVTRTKTQTYDPAGRALTSEETASPATDTSLPKVTNEYNSTTGLLEKQSTPEGTITSKYNKLGQVTEYADASGNVAKYTYEEGSDGRLLEVSEGKGKEAESDQTYSYDPTTGFLTKLVDSAAGTFTAAYDLEGKLISEVYPNKMTATYTINQVGQATGLVYEKNAHCASTCPEIWFSDSVSPSIHGESLQQTSTLSKESYAYDNAGRLLETQETPAGKGCTTRVYAYDEESNRTSLTTREPGTEGKCATEGGTVERHTYDEANRLTDEKVTYETFGNITKLPATDAGGHELTSSYYIDGQVAGQEQNKELIGYKYDPAGRTTETASENTEIKAKTTLVSHYAGTGSALTWTSEGTEKWVRNIPGIDGSLAAIQESGGAVALEIHDLQGDIVGKAAVSETETKLISTYNSTEFGVPTTSNPPKYSWLGADGVASELTASGVSTQNGSSYVPEIGRPLQTGPIASPGSFPNGTASVGIVNAPYLGAATGQLMNIAIQGNAEREEAKKREADEKAESEEPLASEGPEPEEGGATCDEEIEGCGPDPQHGDNTHVCHIWASWGVNLFNNDITVYGRYECEYETYFELQIALQLVEYGGLEGGIYNTEHTASKDFPHESEGVLSKDWECQQGKSYRAWVFGRFWYKGGGTVWDATALDGRLVQCSGHFDGPGPE